MGDFRCPRARSDMTPCYVKHGDSVICSIYYAGLNRQACVGCERSIIMLHEERVAFLAREERA
jgi:hypothetical protein